MADDARDYVAQLYQQELGRTGEAATSDPGLQAWADAIASGAMSREAVQQAIAGSQEGVRYDIGSAYQQQLGRSGADDPGMQQWVNAVTGGGMTTQQAIDQIARSQEAARYDIGREYTGTLQRKGTYEEIAAKDPGLAQWEQALMSGAITEQQFRDAVRQSEEYKALTAGPVNKTPTPVQTPIQTPTQTPLTPALTQYAGQLGQLQQQAINSVNQGYFQPTYSAPQISQIPVTSAATTAAPAATTTTAAPVAAQPITPAPAVSVPQTYLAPAPPQYRNIDPFQSPFTTPFRSYFDIANANRQMRYPYPSPYLGQQGQQYSPFPYYQGMYAQPAPQPQQGLPAGPTATPTTTPTV